MAKGIFDKGEFFGPDEKGKLPWDKILFWAVVVWAIMSTKWYGW